MVRKVSKKKLIDILKGSNKDAVVEEYQNIADCIRSDTKRSGPGGRPHGPGVGSGQRPGPHHQIAVQAHSGHLRPLWQR